MVLVELRLGWKTSTQHSCRYRSLANVSIEFRQHDWPWRSHVYPLVDGTPPFRGGEEKAVPTFDVGKVENQGARHSMISPTRPFGTCKILHGADLSTSAGLRNIYGAADVAKPTCRPPAVRFGKGRMPSTRGFDSTKMGKCFGCPFVSVPSSLTQTRQSLRTSSFPPNPPARE